MQFVLMVCDDNSLQRVASLFGATTGFLMNATPAVVIAKRFDFRLK
jgi:hypothetical protein